MSFKFISAHCVAYEQVGELAQGSIKVSGIAVECRVNQEGWSPEPLPREPPSLGKPHRWRPGLVVMDGAFAIDDHQVDVSQLRQHGRIFSPIPTHWPTPNYIEIIQPKEGLEIVHDQRTAMMT